jgi:ABC-2 type transport system ATP-binding protein
MVLTLTVYQAYIECMRYTVRASGLTKSFGGQAALQDVDLAIETSSIFALLGPNGAGKTTMVRILATLIRADAGAATIAGHDLLADPAGVRRSISLTGQYAAVDDLLTGEENLEMMARLLRLPRRAARARADELLTGFGLADARHRRARTYSGGMRRRLDLAISMITTPRLLFLDEPTSGLDPRSREQVWGAVRGLADQGVTILLTTQYLEEADELADMIAVLDRGRVIARGTADELKSSLGSEVVRLQFADDASYESAVRSLPAGRADRRLRLVEIETGGSAADVHAVLGRLDAAGLAAVKVSTRRPSLDDVFLALTGAGPGRQHEPARPHRRDEPADSPKEMAR